MKKLSFANHRADTPLAICISRLFLIGTFAVPDVWLRVVTRWIGVYSIYEPAPNLFTMLWAILITTVITMIPSRKWGRIAYGVVYFTIAVYALVQYSAYLILGKFLYVSDFLFAGEGADYASWAIDLLTPGFLAQVLCLLAVGIAGIGFYPGPQAGKRSAVAGAVFAAAAIAGMTCIPNLYGGTEEQDQWDDFLNPAFEYQRFTNANFDMELTGIYQFLFHDVQLQYERGKNRGESLAMVDAFFEDKAEHPVNDMTGIFKGKNLIVVMMETMDDWMITLEDTPTLFRMASQGICFSNMYTPQYSNGYTFNTEFAFNTGVYPYSNGNVAYSLLNSNFKYALANRFVKEGYTADSYHVGLPNFYNRGLMHKIWGYAQYHSYQDYAHSGIVPHDDRFLTDCDQLYGDLISREPFCSFVITYSPHLPFSEEDPVARTALALYPQYTVAENRELGILRAKARLTDDMFAALLARLEADGLLEDTVIVAFGDHYAYGLSDKTQLQQLSEDAGSSILERTPAFIYCAGADLSMAVDKMMQITDLSPTIMNLFGLDVPKEIMGRDIFDETYEGHVIFPNGSWLTGSAYVKNGVIQWNNGMSQEEIAAMNAYVHQVYQINDAILDSDYYAHDQE